MQTPHEMKYIRKRSNYPIFIILIRNNQNNLRSSNTFWGLKEGCVIFSLPVKVFSFMNSSQVLSSRTCLLKEMRLFMKHLYFLILFEQNFEYIW